MNKKIVSALLLGAFTVTSTSMLVSCKDYDDDITDLENQINANKAAIEKIQQLINSGSVITNVTNSADKVVVTLSNGKSFEIKNGKDGAAGAAGVAGKDADVWTIGTDGYWYKNETKTEWYALGTKGDKGDTGATGAQGEKGDKGDKGDTGATGAQGEKGDKGDKGDTGATGAQGEKGEKGDTGAQGPQGETGATGATGNYFKPNYESGYFDEYKSDGTRVGQTDIKWTGKGITAVDDGRYITFYNIEVAGQLQSIRIAKGAMLSGMRFNPDEYYQGIEAMPVDAYEYYPLTLKTPDLNKNQITDAPTRSTVNFSTVPDVTFNYTLNPSNALIDEDINKFSFTVADKKYTRSLVNNDMKVTKVVRKSDGTIDVTAHITNADEIKKIASTGNSEVTITALSYAEGDTVIVSDFAAMRRQIVTDFKINDNRNPLADNHLVEAANDPNISTFDVPYNTSIDLKQYINVHYNVNGGGDIEFEADKMAKKGFELNYELIGYISGANNTNESKHAKIENGVVTPQGLNGQAAKSSIGRHPLVRVSLVDKVNNKVAAVGYVKVNITDVAVVPVDAGTYTENHDYTLKCSTDAFLTDEHWLTWDQVETNILDKVHLSRAEFDDRYKLDGVASGVSGVNVATQYEKNADGQWVAVTDAAKIFGVVKNTATDAADHQTDVLTWTITNDEAYTHVAANGAAPKTVTVRFISKSGDARIAPVYVTLAWTSQNSKITPVAEITDANKVVSLWFAANSKNAGFDELHAHVQAAQGGAQDEFDFSVAHSTFKDAAGDLAVPTEIVKAQLWNNYQSLARYLKVRYEFVIPNYAKAGSAQHGADYYALSVALEDAGYPTERSVLRATVNNVTKDIAYVIPESGNVVYLHNDYAEDILNYASHSELAPGKTLTARVEMKAVTCAPAENLVKINGNGFDVKFLRPITLNRSTVGTIVDADPSKHEADVEMSFVDWRDMNNAQVKTASGNTTDLYSFYGIRSVVKDGSRVVTSNFVNGGNDFRALSTTDFDIQYTGVTSVNGTNWGKVKYEKKTQIAVHEFKVRIPIVVTYDWGKLYTEIEVTVKPTVANANAVARR